jgi:DNA primase
MRVKAVKLPVGKDPADLAIEDAKDLTKRIADAKPIVEFFLSVLAESEGDQHRLILLAEKTVLPLLAAIESPMEREHFVSIAARSLGSTPEAIRAGLVRLPKEPGEGKLQTVTLQGKTAPVRTTVQKLGSRLHAIYMQYPDSLIAKRVESEYSRVIGAPFPDEPPPENEIFEAGIDYGEAPGETDADDLVRAFEKAYVAEQLQAATARLRVAETARDEAAIREAEQECQRLTRLLASF